MLGEILEPARATPVYEQVDVLVVGGGAAGAAAAVASARAGARTLLAEQDGALGGLATQGLIALLLSLDDGNGRQVIGGLCQEIVDRTRLLGGVIAPPAEEWGADSSERVAHYRARGLIWGGSGAHHRVRYAVAYEPEALRQALAQLLREAGVELLLRAVATDTLRSERGLSGVSFHTLAGRRAVLARVVIDATGDGVLLRAAGCEVASERVHPWLWFRVGGVRDADEQIAARAGGFLTPARDVLLFPWGSAAKLGRNIDPLDPRERSLAELDCRDRVWSEVARLRSEVPELSTAHLCEAATQLGITESRRLIGRFVLERSHRDRDFADAIALTGHWTKYGAMYAIPYGCLVAREQPNLLAAGRCISVDHATHNATKEIPACFATGQAAGLAAALAASGDGDCGRVDVAELRRELLRAGAILDYPFERSRASGEPTRELT